MLTVGHLPVTDLAELRDTWTRHGNKYTSPDGNCVVRIGDDCSLGDGCSLGDRCSLGYGCSLGDGYSLPVPPLWFSGPRYSIGYSRPGIVVSGCITKPIQWWEENIERCAEEHDYTPDEVQEYVWRVKILAEWMQMWGVYEEAPAEDKEEVTP